MDERDQSIRLIVLRADGLKKILFHLSNYYHMNHGLSYGSSIIWMNFLKELFKKEATHFYSSEKKGELFLATN